MIDGVTQAEDNVVECMLKHESNVLSVKDEMEKAEDLMLLRYALDKEKADEEFELRKKLQVTRPGRDHSHFSPSPKITAS